MSWAWSDLHVEESQAIIELEAWSDETVSILELLPGRIHIKKKNQVNGRISLHGVFKISRGLASLLKEHGVAVKCKEAWERLPHLLFSELLSWASSKKRKKKSSFLWSLLRFPFQHGKHRAQQAGMPAWLLDIDLQSCVIQLARWTEFSVERSPACLREEMDCQGGFPPSP